MYIRKTSKTVGEKTYNNYLLVESVATPKGPRQKTVCSLGDLRPRSREEWLRLAHRVQNALGGQGELWDEPDAEVDAIVERARRRRGRRAAAPRAATEEIVAVRVDGVEVEDVRSGGPAHVGWQFCQRLGLEKILEQAGLAPRARRLALAMILNRLIHPDSEHAMPDWMRRTALCDILEMDVAALNDQALLRTLDALHPNRAGIESALVRRERELFALDTTIYLYDLTSTYFEGQALRNPKARRGYSRDQRPDAKQVVVGLVVNRDGFPQTHEVWEGNTQDRQTVGRMLDLLSQRVPIEPGATVVVDRGMAYPENLEEIRERGLHYIVAARQSERRDWEDEFETLEGFEEIIRTPSPTNPAQKKSRVYVKTAARGGETLALCLSEGREEKDRAIREKHEGRLLADAQRLQTSVANGRLKDPAKIHQSIGRLLERYPRVARYYRLAYDESQRRLTCQRNEEKRQAAETLDGAYLIQSDRTDLDGEDLWRVYMLLTRAENAFRSMKSPLAERPIFHHLEHRVETHIFLCVLAYHLLVAIEKTLLDQGRHTSWAAVRETLSNHNVQTVVLPSAQGDILKIRRSSRPEPQHRELYQLLNMPSEIIPTRKTWITAHAAHSD